MPTTRRKAGATPSSRKQPTLSFNSKSARVTKPSVYDTSAAAKKAQSKVSELEQAEIVEETTPAAPEPEAVPVPKDEKEAEQISIPVHPSPRKKKSSKPSSSSPLDPREASASKVSETQIKKYWKAEEDSRLAPRVHQSQVPLHEKILRHFDLSSQYGPCIGISRLTRWKRANMLGLEPPVEVLAVLLREEDKKTSQGCGKLAYIDELGGGSVGIVE